ncbi:tyrosine-type recombinase/integrase [Campylobacter sp. LR264d]|nr:tyrosine-type recombinase/integrase [Campylobacter sp. LR264d]
MKYPLDCEDNFEKSLLFWLMRYVKFKLSSLSNKELKNPEALGEVNLMLNRGVKNIEELDALTKKARNAGLNGVNTYFNPLKKLYEYLCHYRLYSLKQIDENLIIEILASITGSLSDASKKNYRIAMINFFDYLDKNNEEDEKAHVFDISLKNWAGVAGYKGVKLPEFMSEDELSKFLNAIETTDFKSNTIRNRLILKIIIFTGIRVSEALHIRMKDINEENDLYTIRIRGKGNKYRVVMIKKELIEELLKNVKINYASQDALLFVNKKGTPLTQAYISRIVEQILFRAGIRKQKNGAHMLRHTFATLLYKKQKDLVLVQEALGHASVSTSRIYTHFDNEKLKLAAEVAQELNNNKTNDDFFNIDDENLDIDENNLKLDEKNEQ